MNIQALQACLRVHATDLLALPNVVGYSEVPQRRIRGGRLTDELCLRVYVRRKWVSLPPEALVPLSLDGIPTDVIEIGEVKAL